MQNGQTENYSGTKATGKLLEKRKGMIMLSRKLILYISCLAAGYLMSSLTMPFNTYPLGASVIAAATRGVPFMLFGSVLGAVIHTSSPIIYICTYSALVLMRLFLSVMSERSQTNEKEKGLFSDRLTSRIFCVTLISIVTGIYALIAGGFRYYDLAGIFFNSIVSVISTVLLSFCFDPEFCQKLISRNDRLSAVIPSVINISKLAFAFALIFSARKLTFGIISVSALSAFFITLYVGKTSSKNHSLIKSAVCGTVLGFAVSAGAAPLYMLSGAVCSMLYGISPLSAVITACLCGSVWGTYIGGTGMLLSLLPSMAIAGGSLLLWDKIEKSSAIGSIVNNDGKHTADSVGEGIRAATEQKLIDRDEQLAALSGAFSSLSDILYNLSDKMRRPGILDLRRICDGAFDIYCPGCPDREMCWGLEYPSTLEALGKLSEHLHTHGRVEISCLPGYLIERCPNTENIVSEINRSCARMTESLLKSEKTEVFALDYEGMARILCDTLSSDDREYESNSALAEEIGRYLYECGLGQTSVVCFGGRRKQIIARGIGPFRAAIYSDHLREDIEKLSGYQLIGPTFEHGDEYAPQSMIFTARPKLKAECVLRTLAADSNSIISYEYKKASLETSCKEPSKDIGTVQNSESEFITKAVSEQDNEDSVCGDTVNVFVSRKDYLYALISDGMGTGADAAFTSELCSVFLEKMLSAGNSVDTTLRMLNGLVRSKSSISVSSECSASVDLLELDLLSGEAGFIKSGAVQSFIIRDGNIFRFSSSTVPIGIIRSLDSEKQKIDTRAGDIIIMISDGITQGSEDCAWLCELLSSEDIAEECNLGALAEKIIREARRTARLHGYEKFDDASVICIKLSDFSDVTDFTENSTNETSENEKDAG